METLTLQKHNAFVVNNGRIDRENVQRVLILYDERALFIGDSCTKFDMLGLVKSFFPNALLDINWRDQRFTEVYEALLQNNPNLHRFSNLPWEEIAFEAYEVVININFDEDSLLRLLEDKYGDLQAENSFNTAFFSLSSLVLNLTRRTVKAVFPEYTQLSEYAMRYTRFPKLFLTEEERQWGTDWLSANGLKEDQQLFVVLDSTSGKEKLLRMDVYFEVVEHLLEQKDARLLVFDEKNIGKEQFYQDWLGEEKASRIIFAKNVRLRESLRILGSPRVDLVFGPCTGLLHCSSGIYNHFAMNGLPAHEVPVMITYTGKYQRPDDNASLWWDTSQYIDCLILRRSGEEKEVVLLSGLTPEEKADTSLLLPCSEYTPSLIIQQIKKLAKW